MPHQHLDFDNNTKHSWILWCKWKLEQVKPVPPFCQTSMILCVVADTADASVSVLSLFITGWLCETGTAHLVPYLHFKSAASCWVRVLLLKMHEQSVRERLHGPRSAACLKNSWKNGSFYCPLTCRYEGIKTAAWCRPSFTTLQKRADAWERRLTQSSVFFQTETAETRSDGEV